ncbi:MAG TPA: ornithine carbamoyltransferase subunit F, partial [Candidatus Ozemobacteraceae bacterium]|nr:ornithine carbamoyltransferase subunit F [Candidatus Ozemobacteraceae bacterium]
MNGNLHGRHLLTLEDYSADEINYLLDLSAELKRLKRVGIKPRNLDGKNVALIFEKASTRTRCAFVCACYDEGAHAEYLGKDDIQLGKKETVADTARVLGRMFDGIQFRGFKHETVEELAKYAGVPVWNGLTDKFHPTQVLADFQTVQEQFGRVKGITFAYV